MDYRLPSSMRTVSPSEADLLALNLVVLSQGVSVVWKRANTISLRGVIRNRLEAVMSRARRGMFLALLSLTAMMLPPAVFPATAQQIEFRQYAQDQGLNNVGINCLTQDRQGFIYVCTEHGLIRYDGNSFTNLGAPGGIPTAGIVFDLKIAPGGKSFVVFRNAVYIVSSLLAGPGHPQLTGVVRARVVDGEVDVTAERQTALLGNSLLLVDHHRLSIVELEPDGTALIHRYFSDRALQANVALRTVRSVFVDNGSLWLGCGQQELCHVTPDGTTIADLNDNLPHDDWSAFLRDRTGTFWVRSIAVIAHRSSDGVPFTIEPIPGGPGRYAGHPARLTIVEDPRGRILTQNSTGLILRNHGKWVQMTVSNGLPSGTISALLFDHEKSLWLGVRDQGIYRALGYDLWETWNTRDGLSDNIAWQMARQKGGPLWVATDGGTDALLKTDTVRPHLSHLAGSGYSIVTTENGLLWHGAIDGSVERFNLRTGETKKFLLPPVSGIFQCSNGTLLFYTKEGLYRENSPDAPLASKPVRMDGLAGPVQAVTEDSDGSLWMINDNAIVHRTLDGIPHVVIDRKIEADTSPEVIAVHNHGSIWVGGVLAGIQDIRVAAYGVIDTKFITTPTISSETVLLLYRDSRGWMWVGGDRGLDVFNGRLWRHVSQKDGLPSEDIDEGAVLEDVDHSMWFGTGKGVAHLLRPQELFGQDTLSLLIISSTVGGVPFATAPITQAQGPIVIRFGSLSFSAEGSLRFRYKLNGVDQDWVETGDGEARYPRLPAGTFLFSVVAFNPVRHEASQPATLLIRVREPLWKSWPLIIVYVLSLAIAARTFWRLRLRYLIQKQHQLEALVTERTREIEEARAALYKLAMHDSLTGLLNRMAIMQQVDKAIAHAVSSGEPFAIGLIDLDHFKRINDQFGHLVGDEVLRVSGRRLLRALQDSEQAGRYGGEELLVVVSGEEDVTCNRVLSLRNRMTGHPFQTGDQTITVTCSIGVSWYQRDDDAEALLRRADDALYRAKHAGRDQIVYEFNT